MNNLATILQKLEAKICFQVDNVDQAHNPLPTINVRSYWKQPERPLFAFSHDAEFQIIKPTGNHPLATAIHIAFSQHRPLTVTPALI